MFTTNDIQARVQKHQFVPLRIVMSSGQSFEIFHPDLFMVGRRSVIVGTASTENPRQFDQATRLSLLHVSALEDLPATSAPPSDSGNGRE
jgi:hypothetical protein